MARHSYCIIAHNDVNLLNTLIECIDNEQNDIFLLIDSKSQLADEELTKPVLAPLHLIDRQDIRWGG